jgi:hypothetical protein
MTSNQRLSLILAGIGLLLLVPLIAMKFTTEVDWSLFDFSIAAVLLLVTGLGCEFTLRKVKTLRGRLVICGGILLVLFLVWAELAVGVFGTPLAGS